VLDGTVDPGWFCFSETVPMFACGSLIVTLVCDGLVTSAAFTDAPSMISSSQTFGQVNFADAQLGDKRRTERLVATADLMARRPGGSLPQKLNNPKDLKACYRWMDRKEVTHDAILQSHRKATFEKIDQCQSPILILHDATEMDFTSHASVAGNLGQIVNGHQRGYIAQNSLAVDSRTRRILGLANQVLHRRASVSTDETRSQKRDRESRESMLWIKGTTPLREHRKWIDVCDQGADTFEFLEHEVNSGRRFVIRAAYDRRIVIGHENASVGQSSKLKTYARTLPPVGTWTLSVTRQVTKKTPKRNKGKKKQVTRIAREATMGVSFAAV